VLTPGSVINVLVRDMTHLLRDPDARSVIKVELNNAIKMREKLRRHVSWNSAVTPPTDPNPDLFRELQRRRSRVAGPTGTPGAARRRRPTWRRHPL